MWKIAIEGISFNFTSEKAHGELYFKKVVGEVKIKPFWYSFFFSVCLDSVVAALLAEAPGFLWEWRSHGLFGQRPGRSRLWRRRQAGRCQPEAASTAAAPTEPFEGYGHQRRRLGVLSQRDCRSNRRFQERNWQGWTFIFSYLNVATLKCVKLVLETTGY